MEIIRLVEGAHSPVKRTLEMLGVTRPTFYRWYDLYRRFGETGLEDRRLHPGRFWNQSTGRYAGDGSRTPNAEPE
ncbi:MAG TPA: helix-turn-helix domain-containing protein [Rhodobiaceae bacterium]|nr:helix-turn-helix domain-containing protein [Rhodobiaceae bacterium]